jgi:hypothetical protein
VPIRAWILRVVAGVKQLLHLGTLVRLVGGRLDFPVMGLRRGLRCFQRRVRYGYGVVPVCEVGISEEGGWWM